MVILFDSSRSAKSAKLAHLFASGVARPNRERRAPYTPTDLEWAAANLNHRTRQYEVVGPSDSVIDEAAGCALAQARLEAGWRAF